MTESKEIELMRNTEDKTSIEKSLEGAQDIEVVDVEIIEKDGVPVNEGVNDTVNDTLPQIPTNVPYRKILDKEGNIVNPITKEEPYLTAFMSRQQIDELIKKSTKHPKNNKKGIRIVITPFAKGKFTKTEIVKQYIEANETVNEESVITEHRAKVIIHNKMQVKNEQKTKL